MELDRQPEYPDLTDVRVLVVDGDAETLTLISAILSRSGARFACVESGADALSETEKVQPQVILTELAMPDMTGQQLAAALRTSGVAASIFAISSRTYLDAGREEAALRPFDGFMRKPFEPAALAWLIHDAAKR